MKTYYIEKGGLKMNKTYNVITLCGSTRFKDKFMKVEKELTLQGNIVISLSLFERSGDSHLISDNIKEMLDSMHKQKIDMADEVFVINVGGYIGDSTKAEIDYALKMNKRVSYYQCREK